MVLNDTLSNVLSHILNCEKKGKSICTVKGSKLVKNCLEIMKNNDYIDDLNIKKTTQGEVIEIKLNGSINGCGVIKPRFPVKKENLEKYEKRFLPAKDFGIIIISTPKGLMTHIESFSKKIGGKLIAYCY